MNAKESYSIKEQIQEDIIAYMSPLLDREYEFTNLNVDDLCQIVVDNFRECRMSLELRKQKKEINDENIFI